jgi:hypothetical protein
MKLQPNGIMYGFEDVDEDILLFWWGALTYFVRTAQLLPGGHI